MIDKVTGLQYCEPSCNVNNGGCPDGMECMLRNVQCTRAPCPKVVECVATQMKGDAVHIQLSMHISMCSSTLQVDHWWNTARTLIR